MLLNISKYLKKKGKNLPFLKIITIYIYNTNKFFASNYLRHFFAGKS